MYKTVNANQKFKITAKVLKIGINLGFTEMHVSSLSGELLAKIRHVKFLNMGPM